VTIGRKLLLFVEEALTKVRDYLVLLGIAGLVIALDQWAKYLVRVNLRPGETWSPFEWLSPYARVIHWTNTGAAFGLFQSGGLVFTVIAIFVSIAIIYYYPRVPSSQVALRLALALQLGGAVGNLIDRLIHGIVTDFISVGSFPVFNLADASISVGTAILIAAMWVEERRARAQGVEDLTAETGDEEETKERESPAG
jgi:signal peptidase II